MSNFNITIKAAERINQLKVSEEGAKGFRVAVLGGGCSGLKYEFDYKANKNEDDLVFSQNDAMVYIDSISMPFLEDATLDYYEDLAGAGFEVKNPNASAKCGCGNSFGV